MKNSILVTRYGSTQEVAEAIAGALRAAGRSVEIMLASEVLVLDGSRIPSLPRFGRPGIF
jgi:menaquinone-dependent protoporphyrinogen IX oxidase